MTRSAQSGNPGGPPKRDPEIKLAAREYTMAVLKVLAEVMEHGESESARVSAARTLLDRGWGNPTQHIEADVKQTFATLLASLATGEEVSPRGA
jgi:hypothetical protein